eukprot:NODE_621_length_2040_cov_77.429432_g573_i0.p1 GENE.NODE_621_length_2040_cov_77.429432_g573_i0~~NODE_621_length_2040_cov_77.429432_g573_i0.p1  ORF type:complete len:370 (-),score=68.36 NODE_621_length_2040_cov_77.429432_g573_i0:346-1455(-)
MRRREEAEVLLKRRRDELDALRRREEAVNAARRRADEQEMIRRRQEIDMRLKREEAEALRWKEEAEARRENIDRLRKRLELRFKDDGDESHKPAGPQPQVQEVPRQRPGIVLCQAGGRRPFAERNGRPTGVEKLGAGKLPGEVNANRPAIRLLKNNVAPSAAPAGGARLECKRAPAPPRVKREKSAPPRPRARSQDPVIAPPKLQNAKPKLPVGGKACPKRNIAPPDVREEKSPDTTEPSEEREFDEMVEIMEKFMREHPNEEPEDIKCEQSQSEVQFHLNGLPLCLPGVGADAPLPERVAGLRSYLRYTLNSQPFEDLCDYLANLEPSQPGQLVMQGAVAIVGVDKQPYVALAEQLLFAKAMVEVARA